MWPCERGARGARIALLLALAGGASLGCVENALLERRIPADYAPIPEPERPEPSAGAIWPGETPSGSFLFFDRKARGLGDLVTVLVVERTSAEGSATTDLEKKTSNGAKVTSDVGFQALVAKPITSLLKVLGYGPDTNDVAAGSELNVVDASTESKFEGDGSTERSGRFNAVVTCRVVDVHPGRVFHVRGRRFVVVNHEEQVITVEGLVRQEDIGIDNTVLSTKLAEARLTYDGIGVVDDKQRVGLVARAMDWLFPF